MGQYIRILFLVMLVSLLVMGGYRMIVDAARDEVVAIMGRPGERGEGIVALQTRLASLGYAVEEINGTYDLTTSEAVRRFQEDHGLVASGIANAETMFRLGLPVETDELILYEERRFIASALDALCGDATYLTKVALAGVILKRQHTVGFPDTVTAVVFGEPQFREALVYDYSAEPSADSWRAVRDAASGMSPCPDALYFFQKGQADSFLSRLAIVFKNGVYCFAVPSAEEDGDRRLS